MADLAKLAGRRKSGHPHLFPHGDDSAHINRIIRFVIVLAVSLFLWCVPPSTLGLPDLTLVQQRMIAIFVFAALMWMFEIISSWSTSMIVVVVMLLTISDSSVWFMDKALGSQPMGTQVSYVSIMPVLPTPSSCFLSEVSSWPSPPPRAGSTWCWPALCCVPLAISHVSCCWASCS